MHAQFLKGISLFPKKASRDNNHEIYSHRLKCGASEANMHVAQSLALLLPALS